MLFDLSLEHIVDVVLNWGLIKLDGLTPMVEEKVPTIKINTLDKEQGEGGVTFCCD